MTACDFFFLMFFFFFSSTEFSRWFYSQAQNIDRLDGLTEWEGELYFAERFFNHNTQKEYNVFYQRDTVSCFTRALQNPLPKPDFVNFTYVGTLNTSFFVFVFLIFFFKKNRRVSD